jgi:hypothetical protein
MFRTLSCREEALKTAVFSEAPMLITGGILKRGSPGSTTRGPEAACGRAPAYRVAPPGAVIDLRIVNAGDASLGRLLREG